MKNPRSLVLVTVTIWSFGAMLGRLVSLKSQFLLLGLSFTFTLLTLSFYLARRDGRWAFPRLSRMRPKYLFFGLFGYFIYCVALNQSYRAFNAASEATVLNYTWPLFTVVFTRLLHGPGVRVRGAGWVEAAGIAAGFMAVVLVVTGGQVGGLGFRNLAGVAWGLLAGVSYGFFSAYSSTVPQREHSTFLLSAIFSSWVLMLGFSVLELPLLRTLTWTDLGVVFMLGFLSQGVAYITWTRANRLAREQGLSISSIASLTFALPAVGLTWVALFLRESTILRPHFALSAALIVASVVLCQRAEAMRR